MFSRRFDDVNIVERSRTPEPRATRCTCSLKIGEVPPQCGAPTASGSEVAAQAAGCTAAPSTVDSQLLKLTNLGRDVGASAWTGDATA